MQSQQSDTPQPDEARVVAELQRQLRELRQGDPALVASVYRFKTAEDLRWQIDYESKKYGGKPRGPQPTPGSVSKDRPVASTYSTYRQAKAGLVPDGTGQFSSGTAGRPREERASAPHVLGGRAGSYLAGRVNEAARDDKPDGSVSQDAMLISQLYTEIDSLKAGIRMYQQAEAEKDKTIAQLRAKLGSLTHELKTQAVLAKDAQEETELLKKKAQEAVDTLTRCQADFSAHAEKARQEFEHLEAELLDSQSARTALVLERDAACKRAAMRERVIFHVVVIGRSGGYKNAVDPVKTWLYELISPGLDEYDPSQHEGIKECLWSEFCSYGISAETEGLYRAELPVQSPLEVGNVPDNLDRAKLLSILQTAGIAPREFNRYVPAISQAIHRLEACKPLHSWIVSTNLVNDGYFAALARKYASELDLITAPMAAV